MSLHKPAGLVVLFMLMVAALAARTEAQANTESGEGDPSLPASAGDFAPIDSFVLENGMTFLLVERPGLPMTATAWAVRAGSADEEPGSTGLAHLLEHVMFNGTATIGTREPTRELKLLERQDALLRQLRDPQLDADTRETLVKRARRLALQLRDLHIKGEFAYLYTRSGARGVNAMTRRDLTAYWLVLPAPRLELWFWMESNRLLEPRLREVFEELQVISEERRQRIASVPGGEEREQFSRAFWGPGHPYSWPSIGIEEDLQKLGRPEALRFFENNYRPDRLVAAIVGDFDRAKVERWAKAYFGRLPKAFDRTGEQEGASSKGGASAEPELPPGEGRFAALRHLPELDMWARCACAGSAELRFETVPFGHPDAAALDVVARLLAGRTGRLQKALVLERETAISVTAEHAPLRHAGSFSVLAELRDGASAEQVLEVMRAELDRLAGEEVSATELLKVQNRLVTDSARQVEEPLEFALRLVVFEALSDWRWLQKGPQAARAVTPEDVQRVVGTYLQPERAATLILEREGSSP